MDEDEWSLDQLRAHMGSVETPAPQHSCGNCRTVYGVSTIPCKNHPRYNTRTGRLNPEGESRS